MAARVTEQKLINRLATDFEAISGVKRAFGFAQNPDTLTPAHLPAALFIPTGFDSAMYAHSNYHKSEIEITASLFVVPRDGAGGKIGYIENRAIPFMMKVRDKFQERDVILRFLAFGLTKATDFSGQYGAGGPLLTFNGVPYVGCIFKWTFKEIT